MNTGIDSPNKYIDEEGPLEVFAGAPDYIGDINTRGEITPPPYTLRDRGPIIDGEEVVDLIVHMRMRKGREATIKEIMDTIDKNDVI